MVDSSDPPPQTYLGSAKRAGFIGRLALVLFIVTTVAALFAYAGGWLTPHALTPARILKRIRIDVTMVSVWCEVPANF